MLLGGEISLIHAQNGIYKKISVKILTVTFPFAAKSFKLKICSRIGLEGGCLFSSVPIRCLEGRKDVKIKNFIDALFSSSLSEIRLFDFPFKAGMKSFEKSDKLSEISWENFL